MNRSHTILSVALLWTAAVGIGFWIMRTYGGDRVPDELLNIPSTWPPGIALERDEDRITLLLVVHPGCACTREALAAYADVAGRSGSRLAKRIVFTHVKDAAEEVSQTSEWLVARALAGPHVSVDHDGHAVRDFGFRKSGHTLLYDRQGRLLFSGGITPAASPDADAEATANPSNPGAEAIELFVLAGGAPTTHAPVLGCPLEAAPRAAP